MQQPVDNDNLILLFNGDIYDTNQFFENEDVNYLNNKLPTLSEFELVQFLAEIQGPFAIIFFNKKSRKMYFGRDRIGRKSLLFAYKNGQIIITSCASKHTEFNFTEVPAIGLFSIDFSSDFKICLHGYSKINSDFVESKLNEFKEFINLDIVYYEAILYQDINLTTELNFEMLNCKTFNDLLTNDEFYDNVLKLEFLLEEAVKTRVNFQPKICKNCSNDMNNCNHSTIGILFSGGLDCTILALMADKHVPKNQPIDLLNVSFGKNRNDNFMTPDRITAYESIKELKRICPNRKWDLFEINVTKDELQMNLSNRINSLIYPLKTILDESLGCALWFASRAIDKNYRQSSCRIIISGIGADELCGGYSSHRQAFKNGDWNKLSNELKKSWVNISERNLGRDDRVVCDHGRQLRTPYLDENVSDFLINLPTSLKCYPKKDNIGFGDKLLLRLLAFRLNLQNVCCLSKRALQFGSRIANKHEKGHEYSYRLNN